MHVLKGDGGMKDIIQVAEKGFIQIFLSFRKAGARIG